MSSSDGMNYAPKGKPNPVVSGNTFQFAAARLDHGHISGMCNGLIEAGAVLKYVYDPDPKKVDQFKQAFPEAQVVDSMQQILDDPDIKLVASAAVPSERAPFGIQVMLAGKDYFTDKAPLVSLEQLAQVKEAIADTGKKYAVYYSERLHVESAIYAGQLIEKGAIGKVIHVEGFGPHRLNAPSRPDWFFEKEKYGGILIDIGSHQLEQFLFYTQSQDATVVNSQIANYHHPDYPELDDFGDINIVGDQGASGYFRVDWFTPNGLSTWGDGRTFIMGTEGYIELRKYVDIARSKTGDHVYLVNGEGEQHFEVSGQVGYPFFGQLILDCLNRTENAMTQAHTLKAAELCVKAQMLSRKLK